MEGWDIILANDDWLVGSLILEGDPIPIYRAKISDALFDATERQKKYFFFANFLLI